VENYILPSTVSGDWILDPFFGAGTVGVVCKQHNRRHVGIELNPDYVRMAVERIESAQPGLFAYAMEGAS
jgi:site-specific DNA-methyltransferase (adenine-specific)